MTNFRYLPPLEGEDPPDLHICQGCGQDRNFTTKIVIDALCSDCIRNTNLPDGTVATRNKMRAPEADMSGPEGFFSLVRNTQDFGISAKTENASFGDIYGRVPPHLGSDRWADPLSPDPTIPTPKYVPDARYYGGQGKRVPGSRGLRYEYPSEMNFSRPPTVNDSPNYVYEYIQRNYGQQEIQMRYSEIRDELLYPKQYIQMEVIEDDHVPPGVAVFRDGKTGAAATVNLTGLSESDTLNVSAEKPEPEENYVKYVLSREEANAAYKQAAAALAEVDRLDKKYSPDLTNGSVIAFRLTFPGTSTHYSYAAVRASGQWFPTGKVHPSYEAGKGLDWTTLLSCFEQFGATDFEVLREGGEQAEIEGVNDPEGLTTRTAAVDPERTDAFVKEPAVVKILDSTYDKYDEDATEDDLAGPQSGKFHE